MGKVVLDISISLDGFITGPNDNHEQPLGEGGDQLHHWIWRDSRMIKNEDLMQGGTTATTGAMVVGRRIYNGVNRHHPARVIRRVIVLERGLWEGGVAYRTGFPACLGWKVYPTWLFSKQV